MRSSSRTAATLLDGSNTDTRPVLVVEDCDDDFDTVVDAATLANVRNRLVRATNVVEAAELLARSPMGMFAFMLLDYNLPGIDGLDFLRQACLSGLLADLPAVVLTTSVNPRDRDCFREAGASAFHVKSVAYTDCLRTLESIFDQWLNKVHALGDVKTSPLERRLA